MDLYENLPDREPPQRIWAATVAKTVTDFADKLEITIPGLEESLRWKDCMWQARNDIDFPQRGDQCLAIFDDNDEIWVVAWWPF